MLETLTRRQCGHGSVDGRAEVVRAVGEPGLTPDMHDNAIDNAYVLTGSRKTLSEDDARATLAARE